MIHRRFNRAEWTLAGLFALLTLVPVGCTVDFTEEGLGSEIAFEAERPEVRESPQEVARYSGDEPNVQEAQERFPTGLELQRKVVWRTCTPNGGVCHNSKEYPDLHTPANFAATIDAPCNVQPGQETSVYDGCEQSGDRFRLPGQSRKEIEIGYIEYVPAEYVNYREQDSLPDETSPGLHIYLHDPIASDRTETYEGGELIRTFITEEGNVADLVFATYNTRWWLLDNGKHLFGEVRDYQRNEVTSLMEVGIIQGDLNRNGIYGARESAPIKMISRGNPEESYLIARLRGQINGEKIPGSRMPLANKPLNIAEMLAMFCFVEGLPAEGEIDLEAPIDYNACSYTEDPENLNLLGEGVTWTRRVQKILEANCGGCHGGENPSAGFDILTEGAYERLLEPSTQNPEMPLITPGDPENSYLWLKIADGEGIVGLPMPIDPLDGDRRLTEAELGDIQTWIVNGAVENE